MSGSFVLWQQQLPLLWHAERGVHVCPLLLPCGHHEYKFFVDRQWRLDEQQLTVCDNRLGGRNHVIHV